MTGASLVLGRFAEPQPDVLLRVMAEYGGSSSISDDEYLYGTPEWIAEVAYSTVSIDLHLKREDYRRAGVREYVVVCIEEEEFRWFDLTRDRELPIDADGVLRSFEFPGLWISTRAVFERDTTRLVAMLQEGLASADHAAFVRRLAPRRRAEQPERSRARLSKPRGRRKKK